MASLMMTEPRFSEGQTVKFLGGEGVITRCQPNASSWAYLVEMAMGPEPDMGRVGCETTILLFEVDLEYSMRN